MDYRYGRVLLRNAAWISVLALLCGVSACGGDDDDDAAADQGSEAGSSGKSSGDKAGSTGSKAGSSAAEQDAGDEASEAQMPPTQGSEVAGWLAEGYYKDWVCEDEPNTKTAGAAATHIHGAATRVCTNELLAAAKRSGDAELPKGVASVKEIYDAKGKMTGTVVSVKTAAKSDGGDGWYWYEDVDEEGQGFAECTGCHSAAGSDDDHPGLGDFVYFQNKQ